MTNSRTDSVTRQEAGPQLVVRTDKAANNAALVAEVHKRKRIAKNGSVSRVHTVPSTLTPQMRAEIAAAVSFGRSIPQTAKEYNCDRCVVTEVWLRAELAQMRRMVDGLGLRRAA